MLGRFLEFSVATPDIGASVEFWSRLGFTQARVGDAWPHPYAVLTDGRIHVGLHGIEADGPQLTFMRPDLLHEAEALERLGIGFETRRLGGDVFNELGWRDPSGCCVRLVEARTYSPVDATSASLCGHFQEIGLPTADPALSRDWWERLGFVALDEPDGWLPHVCCVSDTLNVGLYASGELRAPALLFEADDLAGRAARLASLGIRPVRGGGAAGSAAGGSLLLAAPEGTSILVYSSATA